MADMTIRKPAGIFKRDGETTMHRRFRSFEPKWREVDRGGVKVREMACLASTAEAVDWGGFREVLEHKPDSVDTGAARALLINHRPGQIAGPIRSFRISPDGLEVDEVGVLPSARMESGVTVQEAIDCGALRGISVGYHYSDADTTWNADTRTLTVHKWRLLEVSLTPIPADDSAGLRSRSLPDHLTNGGQKPQGHRTMNFMQWLKARGFLFEKLTDEQVDGLRALHKDGKEPAEDFAKDARESKQAVSEANRAADIKRDREIAVRAESQGLTASRYLGMSDAEANTSMLRDLAEKNKDAEPDAPPTSVTNRGMDEADKQANAIVNAIGHRANVMKPEANNPYAGRSLTEIGIRYAASIGIRSARDWTKRDAAHFILGRTDQITSMRREAANITTGNFPNFVMLDAITKIIAKGTEMASRGLVTQSGRAAYETQRVPDFKAFKVGGLGTANLVQTAENTAFPELSKTEGVYSDTAKMWGGTLSLTLEALVSDDTGSFERSLRMAGPIAEKTREKRLIQKLLMGTSAAIATSTWTSNTTSGCTPVYTTGDTIAAARANIGKANAAMQVKVGLDNNPTGNSAAFYLAGPTAGLYLAGLLQQAPGQIVANAGQAELIITPWLENSSLTGYSPTSYYVGADPMLATGLILSLVEGFESVQVQEYDAGAVAARKWKLWNPFEADLFWYTAPDASTKVIPAFHQATT